MTVASQMSYIERGFDSFLLDYDSLNLDSPEITGTKPDALITCYDKNELVGIIRFYDRQPPPANSYRGVHDPHININFHISRFNDIINILRYQKPLILWFDLRKSDAGLASAEQESTGQQE
jgi:hypothetical protein